MVMLFRDGPGARIVRTDGARKMCIRDRYITDSTAELVGKIGAESSATGVTIPFDDLISL